MKDLYIIKEKEGRTGIENYEVRIRKNKVPINFNKVRISFYKIRASFPRKKDEKSGKMGGDSSFRFSYDKDTTEKSEIQI